MHLINYGLKEGSKHWLGKLFVFDDRLTVPISDEESPVIGKCHKCQQPAENYFNCANMDCNELFICCPSCYPAHTGCCSEACMHQPRPRPYREDGSSKPFRSSSQPSRNSSTNAQAYCRSA